jgi:acetylornithine deacetylase/succinyl-diaminopimelate desuccinylase-like protein
MSLAGPAAPAAAGVAGAVAQARARHAATLADLERLVRFPSVSADPRHAADVRRCAGWLAGRLRRAGLDRVRVLAAGRHPFVYGEWCRLPGRPTVLVYGHYDVQPPGPAAAWRSPPFEPVRRGDRLYGRGASDDKGQLLAHVAAVEAWLRSAGRLPVNLRCLLDGEEEIGSPSLAALLARNRRALAVDAAVVSDTRMVGPGRPAITYGLRGLLNLELEVAGPSGDLHAGTFGGAVHNPLQVLCELVARLHDARGRVAVPGFYDDVRPVGEHERLALAASAPVDAALLREAGVRRGWGERGFSAYERTTLRPALTVNGITGGYQGQGARSVIPARASAKLGIRLVPDQDPAAIERLVREHLARTTPATVRARVRADARARATLLDPAHPAMDAAVAACLRGFGTRPAFLRSGGTIPAVRLFEELLGVPTVLLGLAQPDDRAHAPNERFHLPTLWRGIETCIWLLHEIGARPLTGPRSRPPGRPRRSATAAAGAGRSSRTDRG